MASLSLKHIFKVYDGGVKAVNDFCMDIKDKEFIVVSPAGSGGVITQEERTNNETNKRIITKFALNFFINHL